MIFEVPLESMSATLSHDPLFGEGLNPVTWHMRLYKSTVSKAGAVKDFRKSVGSREDTLKSGDESASHVSACVFVFCHLIPPS